jgi:hypothetical protein
LADCLCQKGRRNTRQTAALSQRIAYHGLAVMIPLGIIVEGSLVWNFEFGHWDLFGIWFLVLGILIIFI